MKCSALCVLILAACSPNPSVDGRFATSSRSEEVPGSKECTGVLSPNLPDAGQRPTCCEHPPDSGLPAEPAHCLALDSIDVDKIDGEHGEGTGEKVKEIWKKHVSKCEEKGPKGETLYCVEDYYVDNGGKETLCDDGNGTCQSSCVLEVAKIWNFLQQKGCPPNMRCVPLRQ